MRTSLMIALVLPVVLSGCPALLSDWKISGSDAADAGMGAQGNGGGSSGGSSASSGGNNAGGSKASGGGSSGLGGAGNGAVSGAGGETISSGGTNSGGVTSVGGATGSSPPSCVGLAGTCGPSSNEDCCTSPLVTGGTFYRSYDGVTSGYTSQAYPATVSNFLLDKYEITVGRFRKFVAAYSQSMIAAGAGKNPNDPSDPGWETAWNASLDADAMALQTAVQCDLTYQTWTPSAGANENKPINCIDWYEAAAFCIWDGGRLPTEAEWNYAAAGGIDQRVYPWGATAPGANAALAVYYCYYNATGTCTGVSNIAPVGSVSAGNGKYGQADLAGNVWEWTLDWYASPYSQPSCTNCTDTTAAVGRVIRGGSFVDSASALLSSGRGDLSPSNHNDGNLGSRCARDP